MMSVTSCAAICPLPRKSLIVSYALKHRMNGIMAASFDQPYTATTLAET